MHFCRQSRRSTLPAHWQIGTLGIVRIGLRSRTRTAKYHVKLNHLIAKVARLPEQL